MHLHVRDGEMLQLVAPMSARNFAGAVIMPNLVQPVANLQAMHTYAERVREAANDSHFTLFMTLFFRNYSEKELRAAQNMPNFFGIKLYPAGVTTNSDEGVRSLRAVESTLRHMEELGIPLLVHGESQGFVLDREAEFLPVYRRLAEQFPKLLICMEHITTAAAIQLLNEHENLCATVTLHHLELTLDDVLGGMMKPHLFCKPVAKREDDREALLQAVLSGHPRVMFGSDSAPHPVHKKECCECAAGIFSAPVALCCLAKIFAEHGAIDKLQAFVSDNACRRYNLIPSKKKVILCDTPMQVPMEYCGYGQKITPLHAGEQVPWSIKNVEV